MPTVKTSRYDLPPVGAGRDEIERVLREAVFGYLNVAGELTMLAGTVATLIEDALFTTTTEIVLIPRDAAGAAVQWWLQQRMKGQILIGHDDPGATLVFGYIAIG